MTERVFTANDDNLNNALAFVEEELERVECPLKAVMQITVCVEEMFVNVAHYAYRDKIANGEGEGEVSLAVGCEDGILTIVLTDEGIPFDPLAKEDPDVTLSAEERKIGGLGIYMVKKSMDHVSYERKDNKNIFTMKKEIKTWKLSNQKKELF